MAQSFKREPRECQRWTSFWKANIVNRWSKCGSGTSYDGQRARIAYKKGPNENAIYRILTDYLHMRKICEKLVPKQKYLERKENRLEICQDFLERFEIETNHLNRDIIGDKSLKIWVRFRDKTTKWRMTKNSPVKKSMEEHLQVEFDLYNFFGQLWYCSQRIFASRTDYKFYKCFEQL